MMDGCVAIKKQRSSTLAATAPSPPCRRNQLSTCASQQQGCGGGGRPPVGLDGLLSWVRGNTLKLFLFHWDFDHLHICIGQAARLLMYSTRASSCYGPA